MHNTIRMKFNGTERDLIALADEALTRALPKTIPGQSGKIKFNDIPSIMRSGQFEAASPGGGQSLMRRIITLNGDTAHGPATVEVRAIIDGVDDVPDGLSVSFGKCPKTDFFVVPR